MELSKHLGFTSAQHISNIERGQSPISPPAVRMVAEYLGVKPETLAKLAIKDYAERFLNSLYTTTKGGDDERLNTSNGTMGKDQ